MRWSRVPGTPLALKSIMRGSATGTVSVALPPARVAEANGGSSAWVLPSAASMTVPSGSPAMVSDTVDCAPASRVAASRARVNIIFFIYNKVLVLMENAGYMSGHGYRVALYCRVPPPGLLMAPRGNTMVQR